MEIDAIGLASGLINYDPLSLGIEPGSALTVDFTAFDGDPAAVAARAEAWLMRLPCPSIALTSNPTRLKGFDLSVSSRSQLERLQRAVDANPSASTVLVQALRLIEGLSPQAGLVVESLAFATLQQGDEFSSWLDRVSKAKKQAPPKAADASPVIAERLGHELHLLLNRPETRNEVDVEMRDALFDCFSIAALDPEITRVHVRGAGSSFSIGGALSEFGRVHSGTTGHFIRTQRLPARMLADHGHKYHFHLHGACVGAGLEIAAFGGWITAHPSAYLRLPEISMGLIPGAGGCVSLTRRIGRQGAAWMMMTGARISAKTAMTWRLVDAIED
jgi:enoyl-CoA hydratase